MTTPTGKFGFTLLAAGVVLAGCTPGAVRAVAPRPASASAPTSSAPAQIPATDEFKAALTKTLNTTFKYSVSSGLPDKKRVTGTGVYDRKSKKLQRTLKYTGKDARSLQTVMIGNHYYEKIPGGSRWAHADMGRFKKDSVWRVDTADPTGLATFAKAVGVVRRTGPNTFQGTFDANGGGTKGFLPVGAPSMVVFGIGGAGCTFTATTDAAGRVTAISAKVIAKDETVTMTTKLTAHGKPSGIKKPSRTTEVADFLYD